MSKSLPQILSTDRSFWFCLRAQTKREHFAALGLRKQYQIVCFAPRLRIRKLTRRGAVWFVEAMFPGYFFAQFDYVTERRRVEHAPGVRGLVRFGDRLATIDATIIDALRQRMEADELITLDPEPRPISTSCSPTAVSPKRPPSAVRTRSCPGQPEESSEWSRQASHTTPTD